MGFPSCRCGNAGQGSSSSSGMRWAAAWRGGCAGGLPTAWLSVGYLFIIYGVWELSQDMEGAGGQCWCWWGTEGATRVSPAHPGFACVQNGAGKATAVAGGCGSGHGAGWGWWPWDHGHVPSGDTEVSRGSISAGEHPTLSPGFPSPPCAAVQPFGSGSPSPGHWGWDRRGGGSGVPLGRAGDALSLLLPFNKLVFL